MSDRLTVDQITSDALDALYDERDEARSWARHGYEIGQRHCGWSDHGVAPAWLTDRWPPHIDSCEHLRHAAELEEAIARVRALTEQWLKGGPPPFGTPLARWWDARIVELHDAIRPPDDEPTSAAPIVDRPFRSLRPKLATAGQPLTEEQAAAVQAANLPRGTRVTRAVVDEALTKTKATDPTANVTFDAPCGKTTPHAPHRGFAGPACPGKEPGCACTYGERCPNCRD